MRCDRWRRRAASACGSMRDALPIDAAAREWWTARGVDPVSAALGGRRRLRIVVRGAGAKGGGALRSVARHVADPPLTKIGVFTKDPREVVIARAGEAEDALPEGVRTLCASLSRSGGRRSRRYLSPRYSCLLYEIQTRDSRSEAQRDDGHARHGAAAGRRAAAVLGHRLLQGRDDRVRRRRQNRHRGGRSGDPSGRQRRPARDARTRATAACGR